MFRYKSKYKKVGLLPIRIVNSNVSSVALRQKEVSLTKILGSKRQTLPSVIKAIFENTVFSICNCSLDTRGNNVFAKMFGGTHVRDVNLGGLGVWTPGKCFWSFVSLKGNRLLHLFAFFLHFFGIFLHFDGTILVGTDFGAHVVFDRE